MVITAIKEINVNNEAEIAFSGLIFHDDQEFRGKLRKSIEIWRIYVRIKELCL